MVRWDSPLISIPWDEDPPFEEIWNVVMKGAKKGPTAATLQVSTVWANPLDNDHLHPCSKPELMI